LLVPVSSEFSRLGLCGHTGTVIVSHALFRSTTKTTPISLQKKFTIETARSLASASRIYGFCCSVWPRHASKLLMHLKNSEILGPATSSLMRRPASKSVIRWLGLWNTRIYKRLWIKYKHIFLLKIWLEFNKTSSLKVLLISQKPFLSV
jgi:hypothetical protein